LKADEGSFDNKGNSIGRCYSKSSEIKDAKTVFDLHNLRKNLKQIHPYLDSIQAFCAKNNFDLYFISMPYSHDYQTYTNEA
jgi:virulence-associated protein VapD